MADLERATVHDKVICAFSSVHQYSLVHLGIGAMDLHQQLSALDKKLATLHQRTSRYEMKKEEDQTEKSPQEVSFFLY